MTASGGEASAEIDADQAEEWLVWSVTHNTWWKANRAGYTADLWAAGRYTRTAAVAAASFAGRNDGKLPHNVAVLAPEAGTDGRLDLAQIRQAPIVMTRRINDAIGLHRTPVTDEEKTSGTAERPGRGDVVRVPAGVDRVITTTYAIRVDTISDYGVSGPRVKKNGYLMLARGQQHIVRTVPWDLIPQCTIIRTDDPHPGTGRSG